MADKFPSLPREKQRVFSIDVARFESDQEERAAVVTGERHRLTLFWSTQDGSWNSLVREHDNLNLTPRRPDDSASFGWTPRVGLASLKDRLALVYKRRFEQSSAAELWIDLFSFDSATDSFGGSSPVRFPRQDLGIARFGWSHWADAADGQLCILAQVFLNNALNDPRLVLLQTTFPTATTTLTGPGVWTLTELDSGGWDFAVRREGQMLVVLHRRVAQGYSLDINIPLDPGFGPTTIPLSENPNQVSRTLSEMAASGLVLVQVDLASGTVTNIDDSLPFGENPQIHGVNPFIASVDRLKSGSIVVSIGEFRFRNFRSDRHLLMQTSAGWRTALLFDQQMNWPRYLANFARVQQASSARVVPGPLRLRLSWNSMWTLRPIVLFKYEEVDKGTLFTFGHQDSQLGALRATTFRVFEDDGGDTLKAQAETFALLDLGHRHIARPPNADSEPIEHRQLRPHEIDSRGTHADGPAVVRLEPSANTMNGVLVAAAERPDSFYAYTEMGDGGPRVVFEGGLHLPPPTATVDEKTFELDWVSEPAVPDRAWVRLSTPDFVDTELPGYFISPIALNPSSLACEQQRALDGLAFVADRLRGLDPVGANDPLTFPLPFDGDGLVRYRVEPGESAPAAIEFLSLTPDSTDLLQREIVEQSEAFPPRPARSEDDQPFAIEIHQPTSLRFANDTLRFEGIVTNAANQDDFVFEWSASDGTTATGRVFEATFQSTLPDFSLLNPGEVQDNITVTLTVTAPDGEVSVVATSFELSRSLWATLWTAYSAFRQAPDDAIDENGDFAISDEEWESFLAPGMFVRDVTLRFFRYSIRFIVNDQGRGTQVEISNRQVHDGRFRFVGNPSGQGDTHLEVPILATLSTVHLTGAFGSGLGSLIQINSVIASLKLRQPYTTGVQTSEQRDRFVESETLRDVGIFRPVEAIPSALCCLPVGESMLEREEPIVDSGLTGGGWALGILVPAVIAAVGVAAILLILLPLLIIVAPAAVIPVIIGGGLSAIVAALVGAGIGALAALLIQIFVIQPMITGIIRDALNKPSVEASFRESGLVTYAGEGLAEAITLKLIRQAQSDGHPVQDADNTGRDRFRSPFFETIVVGEGECKAQLRV